LAATTCHLVVAKTKIYFHQSLFGFSETVFGFVKTKINVSLILFWKISAIFAYSKISKITLKLQFAMKKILIFSLFMSLCALAFAQSTVQTSQIEHKSVSEAVCCSLLFPGMGQSYNGQKTKSDFFFVWAGTSLLVSTVGLVAGYAQGDFNEQDFEVFYDLFDSNTDESDTYADDSKKTFSRSIDNARRNAHWGRTILVGGAISYALCYVSSIIDAAVSAHNINKENVALSLRLSESSRLSFAPQVKPIYSPVQGGLTQSYGLNVSLSF
jgi:hypothetical protein